MQIHALLERPQTQPFQVHVRITTTGLGRIEESKVLTGFCRSRSVVPGVRGGRSKIGRAHV